MPRKPLGKPWTYEQVDVRDDIKLMVPKGWQLTLWKIVSGDSGTTYYVQRMHDSKDSYWYCHCGDNFPRIPLEMFKFSNQEHCKHINNLVVFLLERKKL